MGIPYSKTPSSITVVVGSTPKTIPVTHPNFKEIVKLAQSPSTTDADIIPLLDVGKTIEAVSSGNIKVVSGKLFFKGFEVKTQLASMILQLLREGNEEGARPLQLFLEKAFANPDPRAATDLFDWVLHSKLPITPDGDILAWKAVTNEYRSIHSPGNPQFDHHIGKTVEQDRHLCDANPDRTCSSGLHFAAADYLPSYARGGSRIVALAISPTDVVAFPRDYGWSKGRASKYVVVGEVPLDKVPEFYPQGQRVYREWKPAPSRAGLSKTGDVWQTRDGQEVTIVLTGLNAPYAVQTDFGLYTNNGRFVSDTEEHPLDLVKYLR